MHHSSCENTTPLYYPTTNKFISSKRRDGPLSPNVSAVLNTMLCAPFQRPSPETQAAAPKRRKCNGDGVQTGLLPPVNQTVAGVIDGKFEDGYFISVKVGSTKFKGILFHTSEQTAVPPSSGIHENYISGVAGHRRGRKKLRSMDPAHPKPNISGYNFFFAEQHARLKLLHPGKVREISRAIGDLWTKLTDAEKSVYQERGLKDKQRYQSELAVYRDGMRSGHGVIRDVMPIQQRPIEPENMRSVVSKMVEDAGADAGASPLSYRGESGTDYGTDTDGDKRGDESELQISPEAVEAAAESDGIGGEPSEPFGKMNDGRELLSSGEVGEAVT
ncbi:High mobility group B protein 15 [Platanthera zijinensis]|uniref:High mobility group B protein 15 n=1 Tax=Platanthera zijinensis TaxID=2320716 RepID=A0AAP0B4W5_9ASPA